MDFAADFTAIDFETASRRADSACQLAAVTVRQGQIVDRSMWMIRPEPLYFSRANIKIHGITPQQVRDQPVFGELWPQIAETLGDDCLVAHNASFDIGVLLACLQAHRQTIPDFHFTCTRAIARRTWPHHRRYGLKPLSNWLGIRFRHHDALEDSIACAKILLAAGIDREAESLPDLEKRLRLRRGTAGQWGHRSPTGRGKTRRQRERVAKPSTSLPFLYPDQIGSAGQLPTESRSDADSPGFDLQRLMIRAEFIRPLSGMRVVISGRLRSLDHDEAESLATRLGGSCQTAVDDSTDLLVVGHEDRHSKTSDSSSVRQQRERARQMQAQGRAIRIVAEDDFLGLIITPDAPSRSATAAAGSTTDGEN